MSARLLIAAGIAILVFAWVGPLPRLLPESMAAHMWLHMLVVGIGIPLLAAGWVARGHARPMPTALAIAASLIDLVVIWLWHTPVLHGASRSDGLVLALEQASFAGAAMLVWLIALGGPRLAGALTLFFTSMHMTLLGALIALAPRPLYAGHVHGRGVGLDTMPDQQIGGVIMLAVGGVVYFGGAVWLAAQGLRPEQAR